MFEEDDSYPFWAINGDIIWIPNFPSMEWKERPDSVTGKITRLGSFILPHLGLCEIICYLCSDIVYI